MNPVPMKSHARWMLVALLAGLGFSQLAPRDPWMRATIHGFGFGTTQDQVEARLGKPDHEEHGYNFLRANYAQQPGFHFGYGCQTGCGLHGVQMEIDGQVLRADGKLRMSDVRAVFGKGEFNANNGDPLLLYYSTELLISTPEPCFTVSFEKGNPPSSNPVVTGFYLRGW